MRYAWLLLLASSVASAQVVPPNTGGVTPSNTVTLTNKTYMNPIFSGLATVPVPIFNAGTAQSIFDGYTSLQSEFSLGTSGSPVVNTTTGPQIRASRTESYTTGACTSNVDAECVAPLQAVSIGSATDYEQATAIFGGASTASTSALGSVGGYFVGRVTGSATGIGQGLYSNGQRNTNTGYSEGAEIRSTNNTGTACTEGFTAFQCGVGIWVSAGGASASFAGVEIAVNSSYLDGFVVPNGGASLVGFNDQSSSTTAFKAGSGHTNAFVSPGYTLDGSGNVTDLSETISGGANAVLNISSAALGGNQSEIQFEIAGSEKFLMGMYQGSPNQLYILDQTVGNALVLNAGGAMSIMPTSGNVNIGTSGATEAINGTVHMPNLASSSTATTGTVCWTTSTGNLTVDTTTTCLLSDGRLKADVTPLDVGIDEVMKLKPVSYDLKPEVNPDHLGRQVGLIAQDVMAVDPRLAATYQSGPDAGTPSGVRYEQMVALLVKAMQEQQHKIDRQQLEIYALASLLALCFGFTVYRTRR